MQQIKFTEFPNFGVLSSMKVVVSGVNIACPYAGCIMAEMGAQVVQIEQPHVPCSSRGNYGNAQEHRNMYSLTLNNGTERGKAVFEKLMQWADVFIVSGRPGALAKRGFTDEYLWTLNPKLGIVHVSGYGQYGPYKDKASYDVSGQAMGGYMYLNGESPTSSPLKVNPYLSDYVTAFNACICALSLFIKAKETGEGDSADIAQYEHMFKLLGGYVPDWIHRGFPGPGEPVKWRTGNVSDMAAGFSFYDCKDGTIFIGMVGAGPINGGYPLVGLPKPGTTDPELFAGMTGMLKHLPAGQRIEAAITKFCAERTVAEVEVAMNGAGVPNQKAYTPADILADEHYKVRENIISWEDTVYGEMTGIGVINKFKKNPSEFVAPAPLFGEHSREIISSLGFDDEFIDEMFAAGETSYMDAKATAERWRLREWGFFWDENQKTRLGLE